MRSEPAPALPEGGYRLVVLGDPVSHSLSPVMHNAALAALGLEGTYSGWRVDSVGMNKAARQMRSGQLHGANITMPHKGVAARLADRVDSDARRAGSVNTWVPDSDGQIAGYSTDIAAIRLVWDQSGLSPDGPALVVGAGGAAAAALIALEGRELWCSARRPQAVADLAEQVDVAFNALPWGENLPGATVVNATPLGMRGGELPADLVEVSTGLFDMAYRADRTPTAAVRRARDGKLPTGEGLAMLVAQAEVSFEMWTGLRPPPGVMGKAVAAGVVPSR